MTWQNYPVDLSSASVGELKAALLGSTKRSHTSKQINDALVDALGGTRVKVGGVRVVRIPPLDAARAQFEKATGLTGAWRDWDGATEVPDAPPAKIHIVKMTPATGVKMTPAAGVKPLTAPKGA